MNDPTRYSEAVDKVNKIQITSAKDFANNYDEIYQKLSKKINSNFKDHNNWT